MESCGAMAIHYEKTGHVVTITIDRPEARNSLDLEHFGQIADAWVRFRDDDDAFVAILTGVGDVYCVGADLKKFITIVTEQADQLSAGKSKEQVAFVKGGFADLSRVHAWTQEFVGSSPEGQRYEQVATDIERALRFMHACGVDTENTAALHEADVYTSHEALLLGYEEALTRQDSLTGAWYDCSAHMLWIGERTRQLDGAHIEFLRGVGNPLGCKIGPSTTVDFILDLCQKLNPAQIPGRLTLISRMGADKVEESLRPLLRAVRESGHPVVWACDPMHANTFTSVGGRKTRHFDEIIREITGFVAAHRAEGTWPGGIHVELTGDNVTECLGGADDLTDADLDVRYQTVCDPRLNARQSLDLAFGVSELIRSAGFA